jgi:hypothetical protein
MTGLSWPTVTLLVLLVLAVWRWNHWKTRARSHREELSALREALHAMAYESTNAANAIRAHLGDFRQVNPAPAMPEHLEQIAEGVDRIARIVRIADDPLAWYREHKSSPGKRAQATTQPTAPMTGDLSQR